MSKYKIIIEGKNVLMRLDGQVRNYGFVTTRFVEDEPASAAVNKAMQLIRDELKGTVLNDQSDSLSMFVEEMREIESFENYPVPGKGFTWYPEEDV